MTKIISYLGNLSLQIELDNIKISVVNFAKLEAGSNWSVINHCHSDFEFHLVPRGRGYITIEGAELIVNKDEFYITGPYVMHSQVSDSKLPMEEYCLQCEIDFLGKNEGESKLFKEVLCATYTSVFKDGYGAIKIYEEIIKEVSKKAPGYIL